MFRMRSQIYFFTFSSGNTFNHFSCGFLYSCIFICKLKNFLLIFKNFSRCNIRRYIHYFD
ncbi:DUF1125 domain-containing protein [Chryseobacterium culicis]|uniref:DUF1125 domain-containing protein n=1 Tax=Chryseobacterium culicis TaxID=680127 RepID=UPI001877248C|nr:DUF1125 domain-containing protein [Chryseobacterium culicis]